MNLINKIKHKMHLYKVRKEAQDELEEKLFSSPKTYEQKMNELYCLIHGHKWSSEFNPKNEITKPLADRVYCTRCGVYWHKHKYHKNEQ